MQNAILRSSRPVVGGLAALASLAVVLSCGWLATMELILRRPDYEIRFLVEFLIVIESAMTIAVLRGLAPAALRWPILAGAAATGLLGGWVVAEDLSLPGLPARAHFEGYLLIIGLALVSYGVLTVIAMWGRPEGPRYRCCRCAAAVAAGVGASLLMSL